MKRILVVDDSVVIQELIGKYFAERSDYEMVSAEDGEVALEIVEQERPDLIILDIILPRINGIAFMSDLRRIDGAEDIPVIMVSGTMVDDATKEECRSLGAAAFYEKPMDMEKLLDNVRRLLGENTG